MADQKLHEHYTPAPGLPPGYAEGPRFSVRTWREPVTGCAAPLSWFARIVLVLPATPPFADEHPALDERQAVSTWPDTPSFTLGGAVEAAVWKWERIWGAGAGASEALWAARHAAGAGDE